MEVQWTLVLFTMLTGLGAGAFAFVAVGEWLGWAQSVRRPGALVALAALILGGIASVFHLAHPLRAFAVLGHLGTPMGLELSFLALTLIAVAAYLAVEKTGSAAVRKAIATTGLILGTLLVLAVGATYVLPARPAWNTWFLPLSFLISAGVLGIFTGYALLARSRGDAAELKGVNRLALVALVAQAAVLLLYAIDVATTTDPAVAPVLSSAMLLLFWAVVLGVGTLLPFLLALSPSLAARAPMGVAAAGLVLAVVGGVVGRVIMYNVGTGYPLGF